MAKLSTKPYKWDIPNIKDFSEKWKVEDQKLDDLINKSFNLPPGQIVGAVYWGTVADGRAYYIVTKEKPLTLEWIPVADAWELPEPYIRGLTKNDILDHLYREKTMRRLFSKK